MALLESLAADTDDRTRMSSDDNSTTMILDTRSKAIYTTIYCSCKMPNIPVSN